MAARPWGTPAELDGVLLPQWVGGAAVEDISSFTVDPRSGALVPLASTEDVERHLATIAPALPRWLARSDQQRREAVRSMAGAIEERKAELIEVLMFEFDLERDLAEAQVRRSWERMRDIASEPDFRHDRVTPGICAFVLSRHRRGKVLAASLARVLMNESIVVIKPSLATPLTTHLMTEVVCEAAPAGVVNLIHGDEETVDALVSSPLVGSIYVDGSSEAEAHVLHLGEVFAKQVVLYSEDARFSAADQSIQDSDSKRWGTRG